MIANCLGSSIIDVRLCNEHTSDDDSSQYPTKPDQPRMGQHIRATNGTTHQMISISIQQNQTRHEWVCIEKW